jgi:hypothetical protein
MTTPDPYEPPPAAHQLEHTPRLETATGSYPAVVLKPEPRGRVVLGLVLDVVALICVTVLIALDKISAAEGLPWVALLLGLKARTATRKNGNGSTPTHQSGGAILGLLGL